MSRKDLFHNHVKHILEHEGRTISDDPLYLSFGNVNVQIYLAAEQIIAAEKEDKKIAVEVKSFSRTSKITEFYSCLGQYLTYKVASSRTRTSTIFSSSCHYMILYFKNI
ncbi:MAG: fatty-acid oxidation protein subunit alpha [Hormoscilla sp. GM102CHS1]|nr:fatty-acid oxidation protein subunit alpha [Hormoscilla sp. GM102CHS1]